MHSSSELEINTDESVREEKIYEFVNSKRNSTATGAKNMNDVHFDY